MDGLEIPLEGQKLPSKLAPKSVWVFDRLVVQFLIMIKVVEMSLSSSFAKESLGYAMRLSVGSMLWWINV